MPVASGGTPKLLSTTEATELACTVLPMPKPAIEPKIAKAGASQNHFLLSPFLM